MVQNIFSEVLINFGKEVCTPPGNLSIIDRKRKNSNRYQATYPTV